MRRALFGLLALLLLCGCLCSGRGGSSRQPAARPTSARVAHPDGLNLLLLGSDRRVEDERPEWRTDTLIVVAIRPRSQIVALFSIPRDLWVEIPGHGSERINVADHLGETEAGPGGGPALVGATLEQNLGIPVHAYARIDFQGLERIIDAMGGITVTADRAYEGWLDEADGLPREYIKVAPGRQHMDGRTALFYARSRRDSSDFDRSRRQQQILLALRDAALRPQTLLRLPRLMGELSDAVDTDLTQSEAMSLLSLALQLEPASYRGRIFDASMVQDWTTPADAMVLLPNRARIEQVWAELTAP